MDKTLVIQAIEAHAKRYRLKKTTIGQMAVGNRNAYDRLLKGTAHVGTAIRIAEWIEQDRASREAERAA